MLVCGEGYKIPSGTETTQRDMGFPTSTTCCLNMAYLPFLVKIAEGNIEGGFFGGGWE